jgi:hypothetical protein
MINEIGNHESLMQSRGHYFQLIQSQFEGSQLVINTNNNGIERHADLL